MGRGAALSYDERVVTWTRPQGLETGKAERESAGLGNRPPGCCWGQEEGVLG